MANTAQTKAVPLNILLTDEQKEFLEREAKARGVSQARVAREAIFGMNDGVRADATQQRCEESIHSCTSNVLRENVEV